MTNATGHGPDHAGHDHDHAGHGDDQKHERDEHATAITAMVTGITTPQ